MKFYVGGHYPNGGINPQSSMSLKEMMKKNGLKIVDNFEDANYYIANNFSAQDRKIIDHFELNERILLISEPKVVLPGNFQKRNRRLFGLVISDDVRDENVYLQRGQFWERQIPKLSDQNRKARVVLINANKISLIEENNYGFRKKAALKLSFIDLFGYGWNQSFFTRVKILLIEIRKVLKHKQLIEVKSIFDWLLPLPKSSGSVEVKFNVMKSYKFSLIIENQDTYISEKIFDSFFSGCIPIYIGPNLETHPIPKELYIQAKKSLSNLNESFQKALQLDYKKWHINLTHWLENTETMQYWSEDFVVAEMVKRIKNYVQI